jgi:Rab-GTPase-TBC domain
MPGLPGFLRRSIRGGYEEEEEDDDEEENDIGDEEVNGTEIRSSDHDINGYIENDHNLGKHVLKNNYPNLNAATTGTHAIIMNEYIPNQVQSNRLLLHQGTHNTPTSIKSTFRYNHDNIRINDSNSTDLNDFTEDNDDEILLQSLSQHHHQQQEDIYNMSQTSSSPGSILSNGLLQFSPQQATASSSIQHQSRSMSNILSSSGGVGSISSSLVPPLESGMRSLSNLIGTDDVITSKTTTTSSTTTNNSLSYKERQFEKILNSDVINLSELRSLAWNGVPIQYRALTWKLLVGYVPVSASRRTATIKRKRKEYIESCVVQHWSDVHDDTRPVSEQEVLRQVLVDVPRTQPSIPLFRNDKIKRLLSRLLFIWAMRHPASSYVQGINDLTTPLIAVFLTDYFINNDNNADSNFDDKESSTTPTNVSANEAAINNDSIDSSSVQDNKQTRRTDGNNHGDEKRFVSLNGSNHGLGPRFPLNDVTMSPVQSTYDSSIGLKDIATQNSDSMHESFNGNSIDTTIIHNFDFLHGLPDIVLEGHVMNQFPDDKLDELEADVYWCLTNLLAGIQDHYTADQPGVQRMVGRLEELVTRIDSNLCTHLQETGIMFIQFSFKWMNCLLLREFTLKCVYRLWDTYLSEVSGFEDFHVYVCAAFLCQFSSQLQTMQFDELFTFLQQIPNTKDWTDIEISVLLSQAFVLSTLFRNSDAHLTKYNDTRR